MQRLIKCWARRQSKARASLRERTVMAFRIWRDSRIIARSGLFNKKWYLRKNPDVAAHGIDPIRHYLDYGAEEGRDPCPAFNTRRYMALNPDVAVAGVNPLVHFIRHGATEGRPGGPAILALPRITRLRKVINRQNVQIVLHYIRGCRFSELYRLVLQITRTPAIGVATQLEVPVLLPNRKCEFRPLREETDIIIPVYNGMDFLPALFNSIIRNTHSPYRLLIIDDASRDLRVWPYLQEIARSSVSSVLLRNTDNLGFISTCNRAIALTRNHFVILNTDVEVPPYWLERLMTPIYTEPNVASVTPFTNSGTICSFPSFNADNKLLNSWPLEAIDLHFARVAEPPRINMPTGVGFCMAFNRHVVEKIGAFDDKIFKSGYGEENDWCMRASARGHVHRMASNLFVYHKHGGSYDGNGRTVLRDSNFRALVGRHPNYPKIVEDYIHRDPAGRLRNFLLLLVVAHIADKKTILIVDHNLGGGANHYRRRLLRDYVEQGHPVLLFVEDYHAQERFLIFSYGEHEVRFEVDSLEDLIRLCRVIPIAEIFYNEAVSYSDPLALVRMLITIRKAAGAELTVSFHDYYPLCPSYTLLNHEGRYCGIPEDLRVCDRCLVENRELVRKWNELIPKNKGGIRSWRNAWGNLIASADRVLCFSDYTAGLVRKVYPGACSKIVVRPHQIDFLSVPLPRIDLKTNLHIGVVGAINYAKGADVVCRIAKIISARRFPIKITVIGTINTDNLPSALRVTGVFERESLGRMLEHEHINVCLFPSVWPETFSYVTHELMSLGMPLCCFDLGAPADAVRRYRLGRVLSSTDADSTLNEIVTFYEELRTNKPMWEASTPALG